MRDHYYLKLRNRCYAVVVGCMHSYSLVVGYVKYCPSSNKTLWCESSGCYERVVREYHASIVRSSTPWMSYSPCYDSVIPVIPVSEIVKIYNPLDRVKEVMSKPRDPLEIHALELIKELLLITGIREIGITGSILVGIHNPRYSDIDLIVYGFRDAVKVVEAITENPDLFRTFNDARLREWVLRVSRVTGLPLHVPAKLYRAWRRGLYRDREYSIAYSSDIEKSLDNCSSWKTLGVLGARVLLEPTVYALDYPSRGYIAKWIYEKGVEPRGDPSYILSFESLYTPLFYEGGWARVKGLLQHNPLTGEYRILVGVYEEKTYVEPVGV